MVALLVVTLVLWTRCSCALDDVDQASFLSFAELSQRIDAVTAVPPATISHAKVTVTSKPKATVTSGPGMDFRSETILQDETFSRIAFAEHRKSKLKLHTIEKTAVLGEATSKKAGAQKISAIKRKGEPFHDKIIEQVGTFLIGLTKGKLIDEKGVGPTKDQKDTLRTSQIPFRMKSLKDMSERAVLAAHKHAKELVSELPRR